MMSNRFMTIFKIHDHPKSGGNQNPIKRFLYFSLILALIVSPLSAKRVFAEGFKNTVQVYIDGKTINLATDAKDVAGAISDTGKELAKEDLVEPGLQTEISDGFKINVYRASLVTVNDEGQTTKLKTAQKSVEAIAKEAGKPLAPEDKAELKTASLNLSDSVVPGLVLNIDRATNVKLNLYGVVSDYKTHSTTVSDFLAEKSITLATGDTLVQAGTDKLSDGIEIVVKNDTKEVVVVEEQIEMPVETIQDVNRDKGYKEVQTAGSAGLQRVTYEIAKQNGVEVGRTKVNAEVLQAPVKQVVIVGAKKVAAPAPAANGSLTDWMAQAGIASSDWGYASAIIAKESGSNYQATNRYSGAYGLCQALPGSKMGSAGADWRTNPVTQLKWCNSYAHSRYGSWAAAYSAWQSKHWW